MSFNTLPFQQKTSKREWNGHPLQPHRDPRTSSASVAENNGAMDLDPQGDQFTGFKRHSGSKILSRPPSWHSEDISGQLMSDNPQSSSGVSRSVSLSDNHSTSPEDMQITEKGADDPAFHAAYRLFKSSIKQASEKYGPFLPPDDGSPFLALRLHRLWQDLSHEQRLVYYTRTAAESNSDNLDASQQRTSASYSPLLLSALPGHVSPPSTGVSVTRTQFSHGSPEIYHNGIYTPELRSPASFVDDDPNPNSNSMRSRSQSPQAGEEVHAQTGRVPRPPNAWILYRATMSKSKRPDGIVYSPPEISVMWKNLDAAERELWFERAKEAKQQHEVANPGYKYRPNRTRLQGIRKLTEGSGGGGGSSSSSKAAHRSHPAPSPPPWHMRF